MTNRINRLTVVLETDVRDDDIQALVAAVGQFRGVASVDLNVADPASHTALMRARYELREKLWEALAEK